MAVARGRMTGWRQLRRDPREGAPAARLLASQISGRRAVPEEIQSVRLGAGFRQTPRLIPDWPGAG